MNSFMSRFFIQKSHAFYNPQRTFFISRPQLKATENKPVSKTKTFMKKYGYVGIGVYLALGVVDLTTTAAVISVKGARQVKEAEDYVIGKVKSWVGLKHTPVDSSRLSNEKPSLTTLFVIAYGIHKTVLLPFRLSLTAAITPGVAKRLQAWGWIQRKLNK
ncbi:hypothetical protein G6F46_009369 [Rhizopus delemar]|nr:hypothetical protein G6F53_009175 [Rhizopus delemar]KAG1625531.1 hypothetical protein G6F45_009097 [Rhizopus arrhizus]KAG1522553.1 hypothetical protein G6F52_005760 [Rhizopus delemar]KAG1560328.1 hypothetical protein G6F49_002786 [Rhizopus delemar]KAG1589508.1 hypothetical protein G6F47_010333 [Rhizopus delemar]